ncbi:MAG: TolC family outer membrane protein [Gammaproteobacteria bacterium]|nr:TolC family outer membrane protein [Gammaproteobacteria bacterium]
MRQICRMFLSLCFALLSMQQASATSLLDVYQSALVSDPSIREAEANRMVAYEQKPQARSQFLPQINFTGNYQTSDSSGNRQQFQYVVDPNDPDPTNPTLPPVLAARSYPYTSNQDDLSYYVELRQTLFRWDQYQTYQQADKVVAKADVDYEIARQGLMLKVSERYFNILAAKDTLGAAEAALGATARQLEQAEKRFEVGLIAITDVKEAQAAYDNTSAAVIAGKRQLATALELLRELTGEYYSEFQKPGDDLPLAIPAPKDQQAWVDTALQQNLSLVSSRISVDIARDGITIQRSGHYPSLDLFARKNWYDSTGETDTSGTNLPTKSDSESGIIGVQFNIPIYSGGGTSSRVNEYVYRHRAAKEGLERVMRETERTARDAYLGIMAEMARVQALKRATESSQTALEATEAGFEVGTRTTVDVLTSRRTLFEAETNYARARYDYILNIIRLKQAAGILNEEDLARINEWLDLTVSTR